MKVIEDNCVGCRDLGLHCIGSTCPYLNSICYYCDECSEEQTLYEFDGLELCIDCIIKRLVVVD